MDQLTPQLIPKITVLDKNHLKIDISIKNTPKNLFGIAFHLSFKDSAWKLLDNKNTQAVSTNPFFCLTKERKNPHEIVFGISANNTNRGIFEDGEFISFSLWADSPAAIKSILTHEIFKTSENWEREIKKSYQNTATQMQISFPKLEITYSLMKQMEPTYTPLMLVYQIVGAAFIILLAIFLLHLRTYKSEKIDLT